MGTPDFSVPILQRLINDKYEILAVVTQPDRPVGRKRVLTPSPVKREALIHGLSVYQPEKIRGSNELQQLIDLKPDMIVTAAYGQILPNSLLETPMYGCLNVHASLLPELRGGAPIHYALLQGKSETGITIMYMAEKLDAGDIISQQSIKIEETDHVGSLHEKLSAVGSDLLSKTIPALIAGEIKATVQDHEKATFASNIKRDQERIDWTRAGEDIYNHIRGLHPWPVAYSIYDEKPYKVWWGKKVQTTKNEAPGTILSIEEDGIVVATSSQIAIKLTDIQPSGKKRMLAKDYLRGTHSFEVGNRFEVEDEK
jgi:methionyl-tRNA formyltransferase